MWLKMDLDGIIVELRVQRYVKTEKQTLDAYSHRCEVAFSFSSEPWLNYSSENYAVFYPFEVDDLAAALDDLLNDKLSEPTIVELIEPDFRFRLKPKVDLRNNPRVLYIQPGHEIADISMNWEVYFWHDGLTANYLTIALDRSDITNLKNYLFLVTGQYNEHTPEIVEMIKSGILY